MDSINKDFDVDPTLPLNEASVLPPPMSPGGEQDADNGIWSNYRNDHLLRCVVSPTTNDDVSDREDNNDDDETRQPASGIMNRSLMSSLINNGGRRILGVGYTMKHVEEELVKLRNENFHLRLRIHLLEERQGIAVLKPEDKENVFRINLDLCVEKEALKKEIEDKNKLLEDAYIALDSLEQEKQRDRDYYEAEIERVAKETQHSSNKDAKKSEELLLEAFGSMNLGTHFEDDLVSPEVDRAGGGGSGRVHVHKGVAAVAALEDKLEESFGHEVSEKIRNVGAQLDRIKKVETELKEAQEMVQKLSAENEEVRKEIEKKNQLSDENENLRAQLSESKECLANHRAEIETLRAEVESRQNELEIYCQKLVAQEDEASKASDELILQGAEIEQLTLRLRDATSELQHLREHSQNLEAKLNAGDIAYKESQAEAFTRFVATKQELDALKLQQSSKDEEIGNLRFRLDEAIARSSSLEAELASIKVDLTKTRLCVTGLAELDAEQKEIIRNLERDVTLRNKALDKLKEEYEIAKAKVRRYRAERSSISSNKENVDMTCGTTVFGQQQDFNTKPHPDQNKIIAENDLLRKGKMSMEKEILRLKGELLSKVHLPLSGPEVTPMSQLNNGSAEAMMNSIRHELSRLKAEFTRAGASKAVGKAERIFANELKKLETSHLSIVDMLRKRLEELADFLETLLTSGILDVSLLSLHVRDSLARSLNESRRLSMSLNASQMYPGAGGEHSIVGLDSIIEHPDSMEAGDVAEKPLEYQTPVIEIKLTDEDLGIGEHMIDDDDLDEVNEPCFDKITSAFWTGLREISTLNDQLKSKVQSLESKLEHSEKFEVELSHLRNAIQLKDLEVKARDVQLQQLEQQAKQKDEDCRQFRSQCAETNGKLDQLRIKHGQIKEELLEKKKQIDALEEKMRQKPDNSKEMLRLKNEITQSNSRVKELQQQLQKIESVKRDELDELRQQLKSIQETESDELERLRRELKDALDKLAEYRQRQERVERAIRPQLAKTHHVLKKAQANLEAAAGNNQR